VVSSCLRDNIVGPAENGELGGRVVALGCEGSVIFDLHKQGFDGGWWILLRFHGGCVVLQLYFHDLAVRVMDMDE
jgi:hypothetical protein